MIQIVFRTLLFYFLIVLAYRIMGKREVGQLGIIDLIVSILIAELVALSIEKTDESIWIAIVPIGVLVILELVLGFLSLKSRTFNKIFGGKPTLIISNGKIIFKNLVSQRYSIDDLLLELRKKEIASIEEVEYAFLEPNGVLSIFKYKPFKIKSNIPMPIIIEGVIQEETLLSLNKTKKWIDNILLKYDLQLEDIFYAIYQNNHVYIIKKAY